MAHEKRKKEMPEDGESIKGILEEVVAKGKSLLSGGLEEAMEIFDDKKDFLKGKAEVIKDKKVGEIAGEIKEFVKENPWTSVAIAVGLGFVMGSILKSDD